jgi:hypothetical protein
LRLSEIKVERNSQHVHRVLAAGSAVLMKQIGIQHPALLVRELHAERILILIPRMVVSIVVELA